MRYEDLISDPAATARILCRHIGVEFDANMLEFYRDQRTQRNAQRVSAWNNLAGPILKDNAGKHRKTLTDDDIRLIELSCWRLMREFGYELETDADSVADDDARAEIGRLQKLVSRGHESRQTVDNEEPFRQRRRALIERVKLRGSVS